MDDEPKSFLPALRFNFLTRFYDPLVRVTTRETTFKSALIKQATLQNVQTALDLACGTGSLSIAIKNNFPNINISAIDADSEILKIAKAKSAKRNSVISFEQGFSDQLPYNNESFDRVFSTLAFHHLTHEQKIATLHEILRVLKPFGEFHLADYGLPLNKSQFVLFKFIYKLDGDETTHDNLRGRLGLMMEENGFKTVEQTGYFKTIFGTIRLFRSLK
jgi:ubiquinone/menaquinone biosynthesis C-methylase UbiE